MACTTRLSVSNLEAAVDEAAVVGVKQEEQRAELQDSGTTWDG